MNQRFTRNFLINFLWAQLIRKDQDTLIFLCFRKHDVDSNILAMLIQIGESYNSILLIINITYSTKLID